MQKLIAASLSLALLSTATALADPNKGNGNNGKGTGNQELVLVDGTVHDTPGEMFQHLRTRDNGYAPGNPKAIVDAYPTEFDNVGDLIHSKRAP